MNYIVGGRSTSMPGSQWVDCGECGAPATFTEVSLAHAAKKTEVKFICALCALMLPEAREQLLKSIRAGITKEQRAEMRLAGWSDERIDELERTVQTKMGLR